MRKVFALYIFILFSCFELQAQKNEFGLFLGGSSYFGDVGHTNAESAILYTRPALGFVYKNNMHDYLAFRTTLMAGTISADDINSKHLNTQARKLNFKSNILELSMGFEFNFFAYRIRKRKTVHSPYLFGGLSVFTFNPMGRNASGEWIPLQELGTEGQGTSANTLQDKYDLVSLAIPFGFGYKANFGTKWAISAEWAWRVTNTDYLDDVSGVYADATLLDEETNVMANPSGLDISPGKQRGDSNNNDWYSFAGISITYKIKNRPNKCPKALLP